MAEDLSQAPAIVNVTIWRGDGYTLRVFFRDSDSDDPDAGLNVSDRVFTAQIREYPSAPNTQAELDVDMTEAATGWVVIRLSGNASRALPALELAWDFQQVVGDDDPRTLIAGSWTVTADTTK